MPVVCQSGEPGAGLGIYLFQSELSGVRCLRAKLLQAGLQIVRERREQLADMGFAVQLYGGG